MDQTTTNETVVSTGILFGSLAALIWGGLPVISRLGMQTSLTAIDITALRFVLSGLILLPFVWKHGVQGIGWWKTAVLVCGAGVPYGLLSIGGLTYAPAGHFGILLPSTMLTCSTLGSWLWLGDKPDKRRLLGIGIVISGVVLISGNAFVSGIGNLVWLGDLMFIAAAVLWATYTVAIRAWNINALHATALISVISLGLYMPPYILFGSPQLLTAPLSEVLIQAIFQGVLVAIVALLAYTRAVFILGAARGALFAALVPTVAVLLAFPILGEVPTLLELVGVITVTTGMGLALGLHQLRAK
ncbi:MAG: DMT family transporter [Chloroflexota bacterium]